MKRKENSGKEEKEAAAEGAAAPPAQRQRRAAAPSPPPQVSHEDVWAFEEADRHAQAPASANQLPPQSPRGGAGRRPRYRYMSDLCSAGPQAFNGVVVLFYAPAMKALAEEIAASPLSRGKVVLGSVKWSRFPDSFPNLFIECASFLKFADVAFLASLDRPEVVFEQISLCLAIPRYLARSFRVVLPFFPTGTMERIQQQGEVATAKTLARLLSTVPQSATGAAIITMFDVHTLQNEFYFGDGVLVDTRSCSNVLHARLALLPDHDIVSVAFPDDGAHKRFGRSFPTFPPIICHKIRDGDRRVVRVREGEARGRHVVIVDDLVQTGGTLLEAARALRAAGAARVSAFVTHAIFPNDAWRKFAGGDGTLEHFWVCNTHPVTERLRGVEPFEVLSIAPLVAGILQD